MFSTAAYLLENRVVEPFLFWSFVVVIDSGPVPSLLDINAYLKKY